MKIVKAKLMVHSDPSGQAEDIEFMFNPSELDFTRQVHWHHEVGNRGTTLLPKVNFSGVEPYSFTLQNLLFDTYEERACVLKKYINNIKQGATAKNPERTRPPVYILTWQDSYFPCVMTSLNYRLTLFLPNGTPVKAIVNIGLQEVDAKNLPGVKPSKKGSGKSLFSKNASRGKAPPKAPNRGKALPKAPNSSSAPQNTSGGKAPPKASNRGKVLPKAPNSSSAPQNTSGGKASPKAPNNSSAPQNTSEGKASPKAPNNSSAPQNTSGGKASPKAPNNSSAPKF